MTVKGLRKGGQPKRRNGLGERKYGLGDRFSCRPNRKCAFGARKKGPRRGPIYSCYAKIQQKRRKCKSAPDGRGATGSVVLYKYADFCGGLRSMGEAA